MPDEDLDSKAERMLSAAMGGLTPHEVLVKTSLEENANVDERAAAIAKNRERALKLPEAIEKSQSQSSQ